MEFYLSIGGTKKGPYSIFKVGDLLESGEITPETLAWHRELAGWIPVRDVPALEVVFGRDQDRKPEPPPLPLPEPELAPPHAKELAGVPLPAIEAINSPLVRILDQSRPFVHFWARMFDYMVVSVIVFQFSDVSIPQQLPGEGFAELFTRYLAEMQKPEALVLARTLFFALIGWHLIEAVLIHLFATAPGKALFGLTVKTATGEKVPMLPSLGRSFYVYVMGVGFYQFPFIVIGMVFSFFRMTSTGKCLWDQQLKLQVENPPLGTVRIVLAICAFFALFLLQSVKF